MKLREKSTDFNAVLTVRIDDERYMWWYELHPHRLINGATLPCESRTPKMHVNTTLAYNFNYKLLLHASNYIASFIRHSGESYKWTCFQSLHHQHPHMISDGHTTCQWCSAGSKSNQVCIKPFRRSSMSWIFVSYTHCCITPQINKFKAHDDPSQLWWSYDHLMQFSLVISHCNITFSVFWLSQGSAATLIRWGEWRSYRYMWRSFVSLTVKTILKFVDFWRCYRKK